MSAIGTLAEIAAARLNAEPSDDGIRLAPSDLIGAPLWQHIREHCDDLRRLLLAPHWTWRVSLPDAPPYMVWLMEPADAKWMRSAYPRAIAFLPLVAEPPVAHATPAVEKGEGS